MLLRLIEAFLITNYFFQFKILRITEATAREKNSFIEYCSIVNPGTEKICRDVQAMKDFNEKQLRLNGAFITYNTEKAYEGIIFGWGECLSRPNGSYIKLLPSAMWQRAPNVPFVVIISETIDLFTGYADRQAQLPLSEGKSHVMILNGELRSFRSDIRRRCVAHTPELRGVNHYHFSNKDGDNFMSKYVLSKKDQIFLGKEEMKECEQYAKMDVKRDIFLKKTERDIIPTHFETCAMECSLLDISIVRARNGTGWTSTIEDEDEEAGLPGVLVMYAMNETESGHRQNRVYSPTLNGMLTSMYDTEVTPDEHEHSVYAAAPGRDNIISQLGIVTEAEVLSSLIKEENTSVRLIPGETERSLPSTQRGRRIAERKRTRRDDGFWFKDLLDGDENESNSKERRTKRLTYSSAVFMANTLTRPEEGQGYDELRCVS